VCGIKEYPLSLLVTSGMQVTSPLSIIFLGRIKPPEYNLLPGGNVVEI